MKKSGCEADLWQDVCVRCADDSRRRKKKTDLVSYEENPFRWAEDYLLEGSLKEVQKNVLTGLIVYEPSNSIETGDIITLDLGGKKQI